MKGRTRVWFADGTVSPFHEWDKPLVLEWMQQQVDGYIQMVPGFERYDHELCVAFVNEEGIEKHLPMNHGATKHWRTIAPSHSFQQYLFGDVLIVQGDAEFMRSL